jgi:hypothetical protein
VLDEVCSTGAKLRGSDLPAEGEQMRVKVGSVDMIASVAWSSGGACGITFDEPLDSNGVQRLKQEGALRQGVGVI